jgi:signal transduction histidine kinase
MQPRPLSEGNRFQRWYARWAAPHYARMEPQVRDQAELVDRFLYSRRGLGVWIGLLCAGVGTTVGLSAAGLPLLLAAVLSGLLWFVMPAMGLAVWIAPTAFTRRHTTRRAIVLTVVGAGLGGLLGFAAGHVARQGRLDLPLLGSELVSKATVLAPAVLLAGLALATVFWGAARIRQQVLESELERATMQRERDLAARQAAEARLRLLQGQIQPHFIFNTLSALQHWVDTGDARAGALLRSLTAFLRNSTELLGRTEVALGEEADTVRQYLQIMQARLGERLRFAVEVAPEVGATPLPPGLLLTLVENAVEHGIAPALDGGSVRVAAARDGSDVVVRVRDDGVGLAPGWRDGTGLANCRERLRHHGRGTLALHAAQPGTEAVLTLTAEETAR